MRYRTLIFFCFMLTSCGKSPLFNKLKKNVQEVSGNVLLSEQFPNQQVEFELNWTTPPSLDEMGAFEISLKNPLAANQTLNAFIWMPEMGHGSSPIEINQVGPTHYSFTEVAFIMPGTWILHVEIVENNQVVDKWQKSIVL
jgi:hypothetical protein